MSAKSARSPRVLRLAWGRVEVEGVDTPYKDVKLFPGGSRAWDWSETGTHHEPGISPADVAELLEHGAQEVVLAEGMLRRLKVPETTRAFLQKNGVKLHVLPTRAAVKLYNQLCLQAPVGALLHSTC